MLPALLLLAAFGWLVWKGYIGAAALRHLGLLAGVGLAGFLFGKGQVAAGGAVAVVVAAFAFRARLRRRARALDRGEMEARRLLGVGLRATREDILAAHRRRIAAIHPDRNGGGGGDLASRVNAARDLLLSRCPPAP